MAGPTSAQPLPKQLLNSSAPLTNVEVEFPDGSRRTFDGMLTQAWRYIFGLFVQSSTSVSPTWTQSVSNPPTQAEIQAIVAQVVAISKVVGRA